MPIDPEIRVLRADLDDPAHQLGVVETLRDYARDPFGQGKDLATEVRERLLDGLKSTPTARVFLALAGEEAVGVAVCFVGFSTFLARPLLNVHDLAVRPGRRGAGIGRALLAAVESAAREMGCGRITLEVRADNDRAKALYRKTGFAPGEPITEFWIRPLPADARDHQP